MMRFIVDLAALTAAATLGYKATGSLAGAAVVVIFVAMYGIWCFVDGMK